MTPESHKNCNFGQSKSHTVVTRSGDNKDYIKILIKAAEVCTDANKNNLMVCNGFVMFNSTSYGDGKKDLLFKDKATGLQDVGDQNTYIKWLGEYAKDIDALKEEGPVCADAVTIAVFPGLLVAMVALVKTFL